MLPLTMSFAVGVRAMLPLPRREPCEASGRLVACGCADSRGYVHCYRCGRQVHTRHDVAGTVSIDRHWGSPSPAAQGSVS